MSPIISQARQQISRYQAGIPTTAEVERRAFNSAVVSEAIALVKTLHPVFFALEEYCFTDTLIYGMPIRLVQWGFQEYEVFANGYYYSPAEFAEAVAVYAYQNRLLEAA